jgi:hypothetical protein
LLLSFLLLFPNLNALKISAVQICNHYPARADALATGFTSLSITSKKCMANNVQLVEGGITRGTTALVYLQLHVSLYTGTVHVLSSVAGVHPSGLTAD